MRVLLDGVDDGELAAQLRERDATTVAGRAHADLVLLGVEDGAGLKRIATAWRQVAVGGALWVVYPKGVRTVTENEVRRAGLALGIVDNKVARFSATHTALRFVARRAAPASG